MNSQNLSLKLKQQLALTPQLQQAIGILNMNHVELKQNITTMLEQNFMLEVEDEFDEIVNEPDVGDDEEPPLDSALDEQWQDDDWSQYTTPAEAFDSGQITPYSPSLEEHLSEQLSIMMLDERVQLAAIILIYVLDEDGYCRADLTMMAKSHQIKEVIFKEALSAIQQCTPSGIGARNLEECMHLQIDALAKNTPHLETLKLIMRRYFAYIGQDPSMVKKRLSLSDQAFDGALALLRSLNPSPAETYAPPPTTYVEPEIFVQEKGGISYIAEHKQYYRTPNINQTYASLVSESAQEKTLIQSQLNEAKWFLNAIEKRQDTIRRVAGVIVGMQQDFFQQGDIAMRPLTRAQVADMLELHESTVSRAVNGKFLHCKRGIFELRHFFSATLSTDQGADSSATAVKARIREIIEGENESKPLSDQSIADQLAQEGQPLARRTVAKYREAMHILSAAKRRKR
ncbi:RNA polymerase factor sigma-54 [Suttonella sp. R2A3]|uniref:RNA polymerase factor sigma-54 n=1 Tax=Suttonella sp. R2A3 TaxID=2908648 RepID=UPI001F23888F|nr:RNA polymerase factor sigma-54 [Suttonella sp. R2A3]UJF24597.1 RNA polymerase factor sigma-54 [Suttonella sp. R2A3]